MQTKAVLGQADVIQVLDAAQKEADNNSWPVTIARAAARALERVRMRGMKKRSKKP